MSLPFPGSNFVQAMQGRNNIVKTGRSFGSGKGFLPTAPINSTLQQLSPAEWALLGLGGVISSVPQKGPYHLDPAQPGEEIGTGPEQGDGTYGQAGVAYDIHLWDSVDLQSRCWTGNFNMFGPITPRVDTSPNGQFQYYTFAGFDSQGLPFELGGNATVSSCIWRIEDPPRGFTIVLDGADPLEEIPENTIPGTGIPVVLPEVDPFPGVNTPQELEEEFEEAKQERSDLEKRLDDLVALATETLEEIQEKLTCNICDITVEVANDVRSDIAEVLSLVEEALRIIDFDIDTTVESTDCETEETLIPVVGDTLQEWLQITLANKVNAEVIKETTCNLPSEVLGIPEEWTITKAPNTAQFILRMMESEFGHAGRPRARDFSLPKFNGNFQGPFPTWTRGDYRCTVRDSDGTRITIYASSAIEARSIADALADMCEGFTDRTYVTDFTTGKVVNKVELTPFKGLWFPNGRASGILPDETYHYTNSNR